MRKILFITFIIVSCSVFAGYKDIPVTRDLDPNATYDTYQDWLESHPQQQTHSREVSRMSSNQRNEGFLIVVNSDLIEEIASSVQTYQEDLTNEGFNTFVLEYYGTSHFDLKVDIIVYNQTENVTNVVLIGDLPVAWFELFEDWNNNGIQDDDEAWVEFPCDLYFTDINGIWDDTDTNGIYDYHEGEKHPEISIGRIVTDNMNMLSETEAELINEYFQKNHLFRSGIITSHDTSLAYIDDDWANWGTQYQQSMQLAYPSVELVNDEEETIADDYRDNRLIADYEFIQVHVHSGPNAHYFYYNNGNNYDLVNNYEIEGINPTAHFYNLFCCSNSRFTTDNNMGGMYIYGSDHGLATIGSTKTGSMLGFSDFYQPFSEDLTIGESLRLWWEANVDTGPDWRWERAWFYGMIVQGDPSLLRDYEQGDVIYIPQDFPTIQEGIDTASDGFIVFVDDGIYYENLDINNKDIILQSVDGAENCIIDGSSDDTVIKIENSDSSEIRGFTIQNGLATYGGGININGSPLIKDCIIQNNNATKGGGVFITGSPVIESNLIHDNSVTVAGAGIVSYGGSAVIQNNIISGNISDKYGGGIHIEDSGNVMIASNEIIDNSALTKGGGACFYADGFGGIFNNNLVANNASEQASAIFFSFGNYTLINNTIANNEVNDVGLNFIDYSQAVLINNIIWNNADEEIVVSPAANIEVMHCNIQGGWEGESNIDVNPRFVGQSYGDFNITGFSHCVGAGIDEIEISGIWYSAPLEDIEGISRPAPVSSNPDIGAYENLNGVPYVSTEDHQLLAVDHSLKNLPNPFNPSTTISFNLSSTDIKNAKIEIFNIKGQKIRTFSIDTSANPIEYHIVWNGTDFNEQPVGSGVYFYNLIIDQEIVSSKKMLLIK